MNGSERIRASIEALPEPLRASWLAEDDRVMTCAGEYPLVVTEQHGVADGVQVIAYIALMGPHVGEKVAALLEAEALCRETQDALDAMPDDTDEWVTSDAAVIAARARIARADAFDELAKAIEGEQR